MRIHDMTFEERPQRLVSYETYDQSESDEETWLDKDKKKPWCMWPRCEKYIENNNPNNYSNPPIKP